MFKLLRNTLFCHWRHICKEMSVSQGKTQTDIFLCPLKVPGNTGNVGRRHQTPHAGIFVCINSTQKKISEGFITFGSADHNNFKL